mmetsp:Transcript_17689/g.37581  ORF Transcript_17689/g.37581 Transcript_17689/m.37581 type:complete len:135 (-) Transcript_17689:338-742(-)
MWSPGNPGGPWRCPSCIRCFCDPAAMTGVEGAGRFCGPAAKAAAVTGSMAADEGTVLAGGGTFPSNCGVVGPHGEGNAGPKRGEHHKGTAGTALPHAAGEECRVDFSTEDGRSREAGLAYRMAAHAGTATKVRP